MANYDGEYEMQLGACYNTIKSWKRSYFRKNSKKFAYIQCRCNHPEADVRTWKFFLEIWIDSELVRQWRICHEAYDVLVRDKPTSEYPQMEFVVLETFKPNATGAAVQ